MDIAKKSRTGLKAYFVKNAIPTESNFADLIDAMLNQKDDGLAKPPGNPLCIEATGDPTSLRKAINFYESFNDANPSWALSLNPRVAADTPTTAKPGFCISDPNGANRLFIDRTSGNVGIGTIEPKGQLDVQANPRTGTHPTKRFLYVTGDSQAADGIEFRHSNGTQGIGFGYNTIYATGSNADQDLILAARGKGVVSIQAVYVGVGAATTPKNKLDIQSEPRTGTHPTNCILYATGASGPSNGIEFRHSNGSQGIGFGYNTIYATGSNTDQDLNLAARGNGVVHVSSKLHAANSDIYFTDTEHKHTGDGNAPGHAAIENAIDYEALMILGRVWTDNRRKVKLYDDVVVAGNFSQGSDARHKRDIRPIDGPLARMMAIRGVTYKWKGDEDTHGDHVGLIAQEVEEVFPEVVITGSDGMKSINYSALIAPLIEALKQQQVQIGDLRAEVRAFRAI